MLSESFLKDRIVQIVHDLNLDGSGPPGVISQNAADAWAATYKRYTATAQAAVLLPDPSSMLEVSISSRMTNADDFAFAFSSGIESYWAAVRWVAPGFIPANPCTPGSYRSSPLIQSIRSLPNTPDIVAGAAQIASVIHRYTTMIFVTSTTTTVPPVIIPNVPVI